jgi:hypothetical protein
VVLKEEEKKGKRGEEKGGGTVLWLLQLPQKGQSLPGRSEASNEVEDFAAVTKASKTRTLKRANKARVVSILYRCRRQNYAQNLLIKYFHFHIL